MKSFDGRVPMKLDGVLVAEIGRELSMLARDECFDPNWRGLGRITQKGKCKDYSQDPVAIGTNYLVEELPISG